VFALVSSTQRRSLLDEVDAPLDDSNTSRFCDLVRKMSAQPQFCSSATTRSPEMASQLIGVTMPSPACPAWSR
jgi:chromosome segregation protein